MVGKTNTSAARVQNKIMYYTKIMMLIRHIKDGFTLYTGLVMCRAATSNLKQTVKICSLHLNIVLESEITLRAHQYMYCRIIPLHYYICADNPFTLAQDCTWQFCGYKANDHFLYTTLCSLIASHSLCYLEYVGIHNVNQVILCMHEPKFQIVCAFYSKHLL